MSYFAKVVSKEQHGDLSVTSLKQNEVLSCYARKAKHAEVVICRDVAAIHLEDEDKHEIAAFYFDRDVLIDILNGKYDAED